MSQVLAPARVSMAEAVACHCVLVGLRSPPPKKGVKKSECSGSFHVVLVSILPEMTACAGAVPSRCQLSQTLPMSVPSGSTPSALCYGHACHAEPLVPLL